MSEFFGGAISWFLRACAAAFFVHQRAERAGVSAAPAVGRRSKAAWAAMTSIGRWYWVAVLLAAVVAAVVVVVGGVLA